MMLLLPLTQRRGAKPPGQVARRAASQDEEGGLHVRVAAARLQPPAVEPALTPRRAAAGRRRRCGAAEKFPVRCGRFRRRSSVPHRRGSDRQCMAWVRPLGEGLGAPGGRGVHWQLGVEHAADEPNPGRARNIRRGLWPSFNEPRFFQTVVNAIDAIFQPSSKASEFLSVWQLLFYVWKYAVQRFEVKRRKGEQGDGVGHSVTARARKLESEVGRLGLTC